MLQQRLLVINSLISASGRAGQLKEGLQLFHQGIQEGLTPDKVTFLSVLSAFAGQGALTEAKWMHTYIIASGYEEDVMVGTSLIHMYGKYQCLDYARYMFETMSVKNEVTWNAMITALAQNMRCETVLLLFAQMESQGVLPTRITYIAIISVCAKMQDLAEGMRMHARAFGAGFAADVVVETALVTFYGKCGFPGYAETVFSQILEPNVVAWTAMITVVTENGKCKKAFQLFSQMQGQGVVPNEVTFISLVDACAREAAWQMGMHLHALILAYGFDVIAVVSNALIYFYGQCGHPDESWAIFCGMREKDVVSWNVMLSACTYNGRSLNALSLFNKMWASRIVPSKATFMSMLDACATLGTASEAYKVHFSIWHVGLELDPNLVNALISLYGSSDSLADARVMFDKARQDNVVSWNALLAAYVQHGKGDNAFALFRQMLLEGMLPNNVTLISVFSACALLTRLLKEGRQLHACCLISTGHSSDINVYNALLNMYSKCDSLSDVHNAFLNMSDHNVISYNVLMLAYAEYNQAKKVLQLFNEMLWKGILPDEVSFVSILNACASQGAVAEVKRIHVLCLAPSHHKQRVVLWNALVDVYGKCDSLEGAWTVFDELIEPDLVAWNALIGASADSNVALELFEHMLQQGIMPDEVTFINCITACSSQATLGMAKQVHARIVGDFSTTSDVILGTALVKMHGNCGDVKNAWITFNTMLERSVISWNALLTGYAHAGQGEETLKLFYQMQHEGVTPDEITIVGTLSACSHDGLVDEAINLFSVIECNHGLKIMEDHFSCMIDGLGRAGQLDKAEFLLKAVPFQATFVPAMTILGACRTHVDLERGRGVAKWIVEHEPGTAAAYGKLTNLFDTVCIDVGINTEEPLDSNSL